MPVLLATFTLGLALAAGAASAQQAGNFCLTGGSTDGMNCSFETLAQCQAAMTGTINEACIRNPNSESGIPAPR